MMFLSLRSGDLQNSFNRLVILFVVAFVLLADLLLYWCPGGAGGCVALQQSSPSGQSDPAAGSSACTEGPYPERKAPLQQSSGAGNRRRNYLFSSAMVFAAVRPETKISTMALPPRRLPP